MCEARRESDFRRIFGVFIVRFLSHSRSSEHTPPSYSLTYGLSPYSLSLSPQSGDAPRAEIYM